jgi:hypothetical protein
MGFDKHFLGRICGWLWQVVLAVVGGFHGLSCILAINGNGAAL